MMSGLSSSGKFLLLPVFIGLAAMLAVSLHGLFVPQRNGSGGDPRERSGRSSPDPPAGTGDQNVAARMPDATSAPDLMREEADEMAALMLTLRDNPEDADNLNRIAEIFIRAGDPRRAEIFLNRALLIRPGDTRARFNLGTVFFRQKKIREAAAAFEELLAIAEDPDALLSLAVIRKYYLDDRAGAETLLHRLLSLGNASPETLEKARKELQ
jgi:tetratricopeptide (TPR) repeat protein